MEAISYNEIRMSMAGIIKQLDKKGYKVIRTTPMPDNAIKWTFDCWDLKQLKMKVSYDVSTNEWKAVVKMSKEKQQECKLKTNVYQAFAKELFDKIIKGLPEQYKKMSKVEEIAMMDPFGPLTYLVVKGDE